jgi:hypothetical protein
MYSQKLKLSSVRFLLPLLFTLGAVEVAQAQATFSVAGSSATLSKTGYTELLGLVTFTVASGTTVSGTIEFFVPNITFTEIGGITVAGTGGLGGVTVAGIAPTNGVVTINIPPGAGVGATVSLSGIRVSAVGATFSTLDAAISSTGNFIIAGQNTIRVVRNVLDGFVVDTSNGSTISIADNLIIQGPGTIKVSEGWEHSFSSTIGVQGQTAQTQIIFQVIGLPDNVSLSFPAMVTSDTLDGAVLVTQSGGVEVLSNQSATNRVVYLFNDSASSATTFDAFSVSPILALTGQVGTGTASIQVTMGPIGAAVPNTQFPSTAVPRFAEAFVPPLTVVQQKISTLSVPVSAALPNDTITLSNAASGGAVITARARKEDGTLNTDVTNEITLNLLSHQTTSVSLKDLFGPAASPSNIAAVEFAAVNNSLIANSIGTGQNGRTGISTPIEQLLTLLPFDRQTSADLPGLVVENASDNDIPTQMSVWSSTGTSLKTIPTTIAAHGALRRDIVSIFGADTVPLSGYVVVRGITAPLRSVLVNHPGGTPEGIPSLGGTANSPLLFPFFVFGSGYNTVATVINASDTTPVQITIAPYDPSGSSVAKSFVQTVGPSQRADFDFSSIFSTSSGLASGYFTISMDSPSTNPFASRPTVLGTVRISTGKATATIPMVSDPGTQFYISSAVENTTNYTGISVLNTTTAAASVTADVFSSAGALIGTTTFNVPFGSAQIHLMRELVPQSLGQDNALVRISAGSNVKVLAFRGAFDSSDLIYLRGEVVP